MKPNFTYRNLSPDDHPTLHAIWETTPGLTIRKADTYEGFTAYLKRNPDFSFAVEADGKFIGGILGGHDGRFGSIHHLVVLPEYRKKGIGKQLVKLCLAQIKAAGIEKCHIFINSDNPAGIEFWKNNDWIERVELTMASYILDE